MPFVIGGVVIVVVAIVLAVVLTRGGHKGSSSSSDLSLSPDTTAAGPQPLAPPQSIGDFHLKTPPPTANGFGFTVAYVRANPPQGLNLTAFENSRASDNLMQQSLQTVLKTVRDGLPNSQPVPVSSGGTNYTCFTGTPNNSTGPITECVWLPTSGLVGPGASQVQGKIIFAIDAVPAMDTSDVVALAQKAQAGTTVG